MNDLISRQAATSIPILPNEHRKIFKSIDDAFETGWNEALSCVNMLPSAQPEQRWIPVSERLPEPRVDVWVNSDIGQIQGYYEEHVGVWYASFGQGRDYLELIVNAWMPLPEPYKEGGEQE